MLKCNVTLIKKQHFWSVFRIPLYLQRVFYLTSTISIFFAAIQKMHRLQFFFFIWLQCPVSSSVFASQEFASTHTILNTLLSVQCSIVLIILFVSQALRWSRFEEVSN